MLSTLLTKYNNNKNNLGLSFRQRPPPAPPGGVNTFGIYKKKEKKKVWGGGRKVIRKNKLGRAPSIHAGEREEGGGARKTERWMGGE